MPINFLMVSNFKFSIENSCIEIINRSFSRVRYIYDSGFVILLFRMSDSQVPPVLSTIHPDILIRAFDFRF